MDTVTANTLKLNANIIKKYSNNISNFENKKVVGYTYGILTLLAISFFGLFAIRPTLSTISTLKKQYEDDKIVEEALDKKLNALNQLAIQYQKISPSLENIQLAVPPSTKAPYLMKQIEAISLNNSLSIQKIDLNDAKIYPQENIQDKFHSFSFSASVKGKEDNVIKFINDMLNFDRIVSIQTINISPALSEEKNAPAITTGEFDVLFNGIVYFDMYEK